MQYKSEYANGFKKPYLKNKIQIVFMRVHIIVIHYFVMKKNGNVGEHTVLKGYNQSHEK